MAMRTDKMHLLAYLKTGPTANHAGGWRHPAADLDDIFSPERYEHIARVLEAACFDGCFYADTQGIPDIHNASFDAYLRHGGQLSYLDPLMVLPLMARATKHLGLGATLSTTFHNPYHLARTLASLDLLSNGRACWNVVTSSTDFEARNFGMDGLPAKDDRYDHGDEVLEACCALWDCWQDDALVMDKASGLFIDPAKVRYANYEGRTVRTRGPLSIPRSPQGRPVLMQAGSSPRGRAFAARWAEAIFVKNAGTASAVAFYDDIKTRMAAHGRKPQDCAILSSLSVILGETDSIARERADHLASLANTELTMAWNSAMLGADLARARNETDVAATKGHQGHGGIEDEIRQIIKDEGVSFAEVAKRTRGVVVGTAATVADEMQALFEAGGCDGFVIWPTVFPSMFEEFGRLVVPELQRRGLFRTEYAGQTLRENLRG
jgi:FMN-dependent oxidoreductase (nitrilotriacetate monooxygenase family)